SQFIPFIATVVGIVLTDLLQGIAFGMVIGIFYILRGHYKNPYVLHKAQLNGKEISKVTLAEEVSFLNKGSVLKTLKKLPNGANVVIDGKGTRVIDHDIIEVIRDFSINAKNRDIKVQIIGLHQLEKESHKNDFQLVMEEELSHF